MGLIVGLMINEGESLFLSGGGWLSKQLLYVGTCINRFASPQGHQFNLAQAERIKRSLEIGFWWVISTKVWPFSVVVVLHCDWPECLATLILPLVSRLSSELVVCHGKQPSKISPISSLVSTLRSKSHWSLCKFFPYESHLLMCFTCCSFSEVELLCVLVNKDAEMERLSSGLRLQSIGTWR